MTNSGEIFLDSKSLGLQIERLYQDSIFSVLSSKPADESTKRSRTEVKDLQRTKEKLKTELEEAKIVLAGYCENNDRLKQEYERNKKMVEEFENHKQIVHRKKSELENQLTLLAKAKPNSLDEELVERTKLRYKCLRNIVQVRFSFENSDNFILAGWVFNKITKKIYHFSFNLAKLDSNLEVEERLMKMMKDASHPDYRFAFSEQHS